MLRANPYDCALATLSMTVSSEDDATTISRMEQEQEADRAVTRLVTMAEWWEHRELKTGEAYSVLTEIFPHKEAYEMGAACQRNPAGWQYPCGNKFTCLLCAAKDGQQRDSEEGPDIIDGLGLFATAISQKVWSWSLERAVDPTPADAKEVLVKVLDVLEDYPRLRGLLSDRGFMRLKKEAIARLAGNVTWTASMPAEVLGRLTYDYGSFEVRLATISPHTTRAEAGYIVYRRWKNRFSNRPTAT